LDGSLSFQSRSFICLLFEIDQLYRAAGFGITRAYAFVVLRQPPFGVGGPAGVIGAVGAFDDVTVTGHRNRDYFLSGRLPIFPSFEPSRLSMIEIFSVFSPGM